MVCPFGNYKLVMYFQLQESLVWYSELIRLIAYHLTELQRLVRVLSLARAQLKSCPLPESPPRMQSVLTSEMEPFSGPPSMVPLQEALLPWQPPLQRQLPQAQESLYIQPPPASRDLCVLSRPTST